LLNSALRVGQAVRLANVVSKGKSTAEPKRLSSGTPEFPDTLTSSLPPEACGWLGFRNPEIRRWPSLVPIGRVTMTADATALTKIWPLPDKPL
jgi:hypothetical protein